MSRVMMGCKSKPMPWRQHQNAGQKAMEPVSAMERLAVTTGGTERSWYRCIFPFGLVSLVVGIAVTSITFSVRERRMDAAKLVSLSVLVFSLILISAAFGCWKVNRDRRERREIQ
ncbi:transmembrane protein 100 [Scyliorhinus canicula]|uniref:transmembrane protein 100 n=1 Tax=Scyliorhinus canicula TaxID=7830 RepID=UPI0018F284F0|nr:transmembrane protein 100 [Scyliorhinus canicula]